MHGAVLDRALVAEQGGFDASLRTAEDMDFFQRIARTGTAFLPVPEPLALYHMRHGSLTTEARTLLADGTRVIERAFAADRRVVGAATRLTDTRIRATGCSRSCRSTPAKSAVRSIPNRAATSSSAGESSSNADQPSAAAA